MTKTKNIIAGVIVGMLSFAGFCVIFFAARENYRAFTTPSTIKIVPDDNTTGIAQTSDTTVEVIINGRKWHTISCDNNLIQIEY